MGEGKPRIERAVLKVSLDPGSTGEGLEVQAIEAEAQAWLQGEGVKVTEGPDPKQADLYHLWLRIYTAQNPEGASFAMVEERCSLVQDLALTGNDPNQPQRVWYPAHGFGQKGTALFKENLTGVIHRTLQELLPPPFKPTYRVNLGPPGKGEGRSAFPNPREPKKILAVDFSQMKILKQPPPPPYPMAAKMQRVQGTVVVEITVGTDGAPQKAETVSGPPELLLTAVEYALGWAFEPARLNGVAQVARFRLTMPFQLH